MLLSPLRCSGSRLLYMECALHCARFQPLGVPQKRGTKSCACFLSLPRRSSSGSQELHRRTFPGAARLLPSGSPAPVPARADRVPAPCVSPRPSRWMSTIQNLRRSLIRDLRPVCCAVGDTVLGTKPAPFPSRLPPVSGGAGPSAVCELFSGLAQTLCPANGRQCVWAVNFLSLFCCPTV